MAKILLYHNTTNGTASQALPVGASTAPMPSISATAKYLSPA